MTYNAPPPPPGYGYQQQQTSNGMAVAALVCGIVGLLIANIILGPLAIIFGGIALSRANKGAPRKTMAIWGLALGILDVVIFVVLVIAYSGNGFYFHTN
jgi:Domain of unknown function (DUF4190)